MINRHYLPRGLCRKSFAVRKFISIHYMSLSQVRCFSPLFIVNTLINFGIECLAFTSIWSTKGCPRLVRRKVSCLHKHQVQGSHAKWSTHS